MRNATHKARIERRGVADTVGREEAEQRGMRRDNNPPERRIILREIRSYLSGEENKRGLTAPFSASDMMIQFGGGSEEQGVCVRWIPKAEPVIPGGSRSDTTAKNTRGKAPELLAFQIMLKGVSLVAATEATGPTLLDHQLFRRKTPRGAPAVTNSFKPPKSNVRLRFLEEGCAFLDVDLGCFVLRRA